MSGGEWPWIRQGEEVYVVGGPWRGRVGEVLCKDAEDETCLVRVKGRMPMWHALSELELKLED